MRLQVRSRQQPEVPRGWAAEEHPSRYPGAVHGCGPPNVGGANLMFLQIITTLSLT
jgi:hypothetical protein